MDVDPAIGILGKNELIREGLGRILAEHELRIALTTSHLEDFLTGSTAVELILIDTNVAESVIDDCVRLKESLPRVRIVLMADEFSADHVAEAFNSEVIDGYVVKMIACRSLAGTLKLVAMGEKVFPSQIIESLGGSSLATNLRSQVARASGGILSARESEILSCLVSGDANKVISRRLNISDATVKVHIKAILRKLRLVNRTQAAIWAVSCGIGGAGPEMPPPRQEHGAAAKSPMLGLPMAAAY